MALDSVRERVIEKTPIEKETSNTRLNSRVILPILTIRCVVGEMAGDSGEESPRLRSSTISALY
jgi:hypothetical protein